ncbi:glycine zipper 2TM domain-containing protein [Novosphingobium sp.]|uniref:glycine zipper 2TM domain-containing protein n=1 Tax=Novosphingobium sp. TaxID=1874826 RepID=UPI00333FBEB4
MRPHRSFAHLSRFIPTYLALLAASACALAGGTALADQAPMASPPPGWVWQGTWQDGQWNGQWVPGNPAVAGYAPGYGPDSNSAGAYPPPPPGAQPMGDDPETRRMADRCRHYHHDGVAGGAIIGGVVGGVVGNRVVGGDRLAGTIGGAAVGAAAGAAIDHAGKRARDRDCEAFFADHPDYADNGMHHGHHGGMPYGAMGYGAPYYGGAMAPAYIMVPVMQAPQAPCVETRTVTTEYVDVPRHRLIRTAPRRAAPHRKEKRVYTGS